MSKGPFSAAGSCVKLSPNAGSANNDIGAIGSTVLIVNSSTTVVHVKFSETASPTAAATDMPINGSHAVTVTRNKDARYAAAYSAGDASAGVYFQPGEGE